MTATRILIALGAALVLGAVNLSILGKERIKREGEVIYLELAPVDPRSLMQGDYMALNFAMARQIAALPASRGRSSAPIELDERRVARVAQDGREGPLHIRYRYREGRVWVGTNAFFFEEGKAGQYSKARFGEFRLDRSSGEAVLVGLRDKDLNPLP